ncbi:hypothetical protein ACLKAH_005216 [Escherichia coli]
MERNRTVIADSPNLHCGVNQPHARVLSVFISAANTYNAEPGVLEQTARAYIESHGAVERHLGCSDF